MLLYQQAERREEYDEEPFSAEDLAAIQEGEEAFQRGEFISLEDYEKETRPVSYGVQLSLPAKKQLDRLDQVTVRSLDSRLKELAFDPYATRISKAVKMEPGQRISRVGDWRIIYRVNEINRRSW